MTKKKLYTILLDYRGGTYITQIEATSPVGALPKWLFRLKDEDLKEWRITRDELAEIVRSENVVSLDGCVNAWCISGSARKGLALINIIATDVRS